MSNGISGLGGSCPTKGAALPPSMAAQELANSAGTKANRYWPSNSQGLSGQQLQTGIKWDKDWGSKCQRGWHVLPPALLWGFSPAACGCSHEVALYNTSTVPAVPSCLLSSLPQTEGIFTKSKHRSYRIPSKQCPAAHPNPHTPHVCFLPDAGLGRKHPAEQICDARQGFTAEFLATW